MSECQNVRMRLGRLGLLTVLAMLAAGLAGWPVTAKLAGEAGLAAQVAGGVIVLAMSMASNTIVARAAGRQAARAAIVFLAVKLPRLAAVAGLLAGAWWLWKLPARTLIIWAAAFYMIAVAVETFWLFKGLRGQAGCGQTQTRPVPRRPFEE